jgi:hypothetical protein
MRGSCWKLVFGKLLLMSVFTSILAKIIPKDELDFFTVLV